MTLDKLITISIALLISGSAQAVGSATAGKAKAVTCIGCHGPNGNSANPAWPKLAGQGAKYIAKQLADFKSGARKDPVMSSQATGLSKQDMADLGAYFAQQNISPGSAKKGKVTLGQNIYRGGNKATGVPACMACHGPSGAGNAPANYPRLSSQHGTYVLKAMKDFRAGTRSNDDSKIMRDIAIRMTDAEMDAVASYIAGLH